MSDYVNNVRLSFLDATDPIHEHWLALNYLVMSFFYLTSNWSSVDGVQKRKS